MSYQNPYVRALLIGLVMGGAFMVAHWIDHGGSVAR